MVNEYFSVVVSVGKKLSKKKEKVRIWLRWECRGWFLDCSLEVLILIYFFCFFMLRIGFFKYKVIVLRLFLGVVENVWIEWMGG